MYPAHRRTTLHSERQCIRFFVKCINKKNMSLCYVYLLRLYSFFETACTKYSISCFLLLFSLFAPSSYLRFLPVLLLLPLDWYLRGHYPTYYAVWNFCRDQYYAFFLFCLRPSMCSLCPTASESAQVCIRLVLSLLFCLCYRSHDPLLCSHEPYANPFDLHHYPSSPAGPLVVFPSHLSTDSRTAGIGDTSVFAVQGRCPVFGPIDSSVCPPACSILRSWKV